MDKEEVTIQDDPFRILTTTFVIMGLILLLWVLFIIFDKEDDIKILEEINK
jgi:hypothetical protein